MMLIDAVGRPWQQGHPTELGPDLADELADLLGGGGSLCAQAAGERGLALLIGEPDLEHAVDDQGEAHHRHEQRGVFAEQAAAQVLAERGHLMTSSAPASRRGGTVRPSACAVLRLMTSSSLLALCTG